MSRNIKFTLGFILLCNITFAQVPHWFEELVEEKVKNKPVRVLLEQAKIKYDKGESYQAELKQIHQVIAAQRASIQTNKPYTDKKTGTVEDEQDLGFGAEPYIAVNPLNPNHIVVSFMKQIVNGQAVALNMPVYVSFDAGDTWTQSSIDIDQIFTQNLGLAVLGGGDPLLSFGVDNTLHFTWVYMTSTDAGIGGLFSAEIGLYYAYSTNGGLDFIFSPDTNINTVYKGSLLGGDLIDRQWMDVDATGGTYNGNIYMSALYGGNVLANAGEVVFVKTPGINQFNNTPVTGVPSTSGNQTQFGNVRVGEDGTVHMSCMLLNQQTQSGNVMYVKSNNGGITYSNPISVASLTTGLPANFLGTQNIPSKVHSRENSAISLATEGTNVYIAWSDMAGGDIRSYLVVSNDNGNTWASPVEFGATALGSGFYHLMPNLSADSGGVSITWYAVNRSTLVSEYYFMESLDGAQTFGDLEIISSNSTNFTGMASSQEDFFGDYNSSIRLGCTTYATWSDGRTGEPHTYIARITSCKGIEVSVEQLAVNASYAIASIFPNPLTNGTLSLQVKSNKADVLTLSIMDIQGKNLLTSSKHTLVKGAQVLEVSLEQLNSGVYLLTAINEDGVINSRVMHVIK